MGLFRWKDRFDLSFLLPRWISGLAWWTAGISIQLLRHGIISTHLSSNQVQHEYCMRRQLLELACDTVSLLFNVDDILVKLMAMVRKVPQGWGG